MLAKMTMEIFTAVVLHPYIVQIFKNKHVLLFVEAVITIGKTSYNVNSHLIILFFLNSITIFKIENTYGPLSITVSQTQDVLQFWTVTVVFTHLVEGPSPFGRVPTEVTGSCQKVLWGHHIPCHSLNLLFQYSSDGPENSQGLVSLIKENTDLYYLKKCHKRPLSKSRCFFKS